MKQLLLIAIFAFLWALGGLFISAALRALFGVDWLVFCTALNMLTGLVMLLAVTHNATARRLFYEGPRGSEPGNPLIAILWIIPLFLILVGIIWWLMGQFMK